MEKRGHKISEHLLDRLGLRVFPDGTDGKTMSVRDAAYLFVVTTIQDPARLIHQSVHMRLIVEEDISLRGKGNPAKILLLGGEGTLDNLIGIAHQMHVKPQVIRVEDMHNTLDFVGLYFDQLSGVSVEHLRHLHFQGKHCLDQKEFAVEVKKYAPKLVVA